MKKFVKTPNCNNFRRCGRKAKSSRSKFCMPCFKANAARKGALGAGNVTAAGAPGNAGNASGAPGNAGNQTKGRIKKRAGKRSGLKRSSAVALVVRKKWLDLILAGKKDWEIRGAKTTRRGWIHLAESKATGQLMGRARLVDCKPIAKSSFMKHVKHHHVPSLNMLPYERPFAWVLKDAERFAQPFFYEHRPGAVIWVSV